jgi:hypothetical protein
MKKDIKTAPILKKTLRGYRKSMIWFSYIYAHSEVGRGIKQGLAALSNQHQASFRKNKIVKYASTRRIEVELRFQ